VGKEVGLGWLFGGGEVGREVCDVM
jgi:hypothetical protein